MAAQRIFLVGMMGAGKTTVGRLLAERLGRPYLDNDDQVRARTGMSSREVLQARGRTALHAEESAALRETAQVPDPVVASVAAGMVLDPDNRRVLTGAGYVVWLKIGVAEIVRRVEGSGKPLPTPDEGSLETFVAEREPHFGDVADLVVEVDDLTPPQVVDRIARELAG